MKPYLRYSLLVALGAGFGLGFPKLVEYLINSHTDIGIIALIILGCALGGLALNKIHNLIEGTNNEK